MSSYELFGGQFRESFDLQGKILGPDGGPNRLDSIKNLERRKNTFETLKSFQQVLIRSGGQHLESEQDWYPGLRPTTMGIKKVSRSGKTGKKLYKLHTKHCRSA